MQFTTSTIPSYSHRSSLRPLTGGSVDNFSGKNVNRFKHFMAGLLLFTAFLMSGRASGATLSENVTLAWTPSTNPIVAGLNIYYGGVSGTYTNKTTAGAATSLTISNLAPGATYYFVATTYSAAGAESAMSSEVSYTVPASPPGLQLAVTSSQQIVLTLTGQGGHAYDIQATQDFKIWTVIATVTADAAGSVTFTDTNAANFTSRFYRTHDISP